MRFVFLGMLLLLSYPAFSQTPRTAYDRVIKSGALRCGYVLWPLFFEKDPNTGAMSGYVFDVTQELVDRLGLKVEWTQEVIVGQQVQALATGKIDAVCGADGPYNYSTGKYLNYTQPYAYVPVWVYARPDAPKRADLKAYDSADITVTGMDGDITQLLARQLFPQAQKIDIPQTGDPSLLLTNVIDGKADITVSDALTVKAINGNAVKLSPVFSETVGTFGLSYSLGKDEMKLLQTLNQGIDILRYTGALERITNRYDPDRKIIGRPAKTWE